MVSDKVIVVLLIVAIILSIVSTFVSLSVNIDQFKRAGSDGNTVIYQSQPEDERGKVSIVVQEPAP